MNILPKKKWHVRTKENMARVRRDEAAAAAAAAAVAERAALAEHEARVARIKARAAPTFGPSTSSSLSQAERKEEFVVASSSSIEQKHVNFFEELETQERQNLQQGNPEYAAEKKKEHNDWESKMGIMKRFAEDTKEYSKEKYWWESIPLVRRDITDGFIGNFGRNTVSNDPMHTFVSKKEKSAPASATIAPIMKQRICEHVGVKSAKVPSKNVPKNEKDLLSNVKKKSKKSHKKKHRKKEEDAKRRKRSRERRRKKSESTTSLSSLSSSSDSTKHSAAKKTKKDDADTLAALREERLRREHAEKQRADALLAPKIESAPPSMASAQSHLDEERSRRYSTGFNPDIARR